MVILELSNLIECVNYMLLLQIFIIVIVLVAANVYLYKSEKSRKEEEKIHKLRTEGRVNALRFSSYCQSLEILFNRYK